MALGRLTSSATNRLALRKGSCVRRHRRMWTGPRMLNVRAPSRIEDRGSRINTGGITNEFDTDSTQTADSV